MRIKFMQGINANQLKIVAVMAMALNHLGQVLEVGEFSPALFFITEFIGKITFPIMAMLLVEGYFYTKNLLRYGARLLIFGFASIIPFQFLFKNGDMIFPIANIMFTIFWGLILIYLLDNIKEVILRIPIILLFSFLTLLSDWYLFGVVMIAGFYFVRDNRVLKSLIPIFIMCLYIGFIIIFKKQLGFVLNNASTYFGMLLTAPLIYGYNGERGKFSKTIKYGFYLFYPAHLWFLLFIKVLFKN